MKLVRKAFTLIELLVVIAIIAILAAILFPVFAQAKAAAKQISALSNIKQAAISTMIYANDYDDKMPLYTYPHQGTDGVWRWVTWRVWIQPYMKTPNLFELANYRKGDWSAASRIHWLTDFEDARRDIPFGIAGIHSWAHSAYAPDGFNLTTVPSSANYLAFSTSRFAWGDIGTWTINWLDAPGSSKGTFVANAKKSNFVFFDTHARSMNPCSTFGKLAWANGEVPHEDFLWEWWAGPESSVLRDWRDGAQPGSQAGDYGCIDIPEYR